MPGPESGIVHTYVSEMLWMLSGFCGYFCILVLRRETLKKADYFNP